VSRSYGEAGLGVFSYLLSLYFIIGFLSEFGIPKYIEQKLTALKSAAAQPTLLSDAFRAILCSSLLCGALLALSSKFICAHTQIEEEFLAYLIIGLTLPLRGFNKLKLAVLRGTGNHTGAANLQITRILVSAISVFLLLSIGALPSYLIMGVFTGEVFAAISGYKKLQLPHAWRPLRNRHRIRTTLRNSRAYIFTNDALDIIFYLDFFILGLMVSSRELGVYAEASILARFFLIIPVSTRPLLHGLYCALAEKSDALLAIYVRKASAAIYLVHSLFGLCLLLYYPSILNGLFQSYGDELISFQIFTILFPGLLYFSIALALEPLYEVQGKTIGLQRLVILISTINLAANLYLVPFAGIFGAACATTLSMLAYFFLITSSLIKGREISRTLYLYAGASVYVVYIFVHGLDFDISISFWLAPLLLCALFFLINLFDFEKS
jgi:O-antigen/teichoic acid export membrane protein